MSRTDRHERKKKPHKRRKRWWHKPTWKDVFLYGPLAVFFLVVGIGPFVYEFWHHRDLLYGLILLAAIAIFVFFLWPRKKS
jgi:hypothetical protein